MDYRWLATEAVINGANPTFVGKLLGVILDLTWWQVVGQPRLEANLKQDRCRRMLYMLALLPPHQHQECQERFEAVVFPAHKRPEVKAMLPFVWGGAKEVVHGEAEEVEQPPSKFAFV